MYQLAARMGTKMMGGLGFHEVLNNVSKPENQNTAIAFLLSYYILYEVYILLFHPKKWKYKKVLSVIFIMLYRGKNNDFLLFPLTVQFLNFSLFIPHVPHTHTHTPPIPVFSIVAHILILSKMKSIVNFLLFCLFA